jgi:hypothetical protein
VALPRRRWWLRRRALQLRVVETVPQSHYSSAELTGRTCCHCRTLERDFSVAAQPKQRPRRGGVDYNSALKPRSPLVMCEWWRIAMDEVRSSRLLLLSEPPIADACSRTSIPQVQLSGRPRIEDMVSLLPRVNSLAVSGTPAKAKVEDLRSTLQSVISATVVVLAQPLTPSTAFSCRFLRQFPVAYFPRLVEPGFAITFEKLFQRIATRTTKAKVNQELTVRLFRAAPSNVATRLIALSNACLPSRFRPRRGCSSRLT